MNCRCGTPGGCRSRHTIELAEVQQHAATIIAHLVAPICCLAPGLCRQPQSAVGGVGGGKPRRLFVCCHLALQRRVPAVFDGVVRPAVVRTRVWRRPNTRRSCTMQACRHIWRIVLPAGQHLGDVRPSVAQLRVSLRATCQGVASDQCGKVGPQARWRAVNAHGVATAVPRASRRWRTSIRMRSSSGWKGPRLTSGHSWLNHLKAADVTSSKPSTHIFTRCHRTRPRRDR